MNVIKTDNVLQDFVRVICLEGRSDELIKACDIYHFKFENEERAFEFGFNLGEYMGKYNFGEDVYYFDFPEDDTRVFFIGSFKQVRDKIYEVL